MSRLLKLGNTFSSCPPFTPSSPALTLVLVLPVIINLTTRIPPPHNAHPCTDAIDTEICNPASWMGYDGQVCGDCSALVKVRDNGGTCKEYCSRQDLSCSDSWDDTTGEQCSMNAPRRGCSYQWTSTSDAICECDVVSSVESVIAAEPPPAPGVSHCGREFL